MSDLTPREEMRQRSIRGLSWGALACVGVVGGFQTIGLSPKENGVQKPLRAVLEMNGWIATNLQSNGRLPERLRRSDAAGTPRFNGTEGLSEPFDPSAWTMTLVGGRTSDPITIDQIKALPNVEEVTKFKCVEGWSQNIQAKGTKLSDFLQAYGPTLPPGVEWREADLDKLPKWIGLETPDHGYYVGIDMKSALHPSTILCWEEDGKPLSKPEGAPLRLLIPLKYGIKHLKRIGTMTITNERPKDFWFEQGYDYFAGH